MTNHTQFKKITAPFSLFQSNCKLQVFYMSTKNEFTLIYCLIICFILTPFLSLHSQLILPSLLKLQSQMIPNECGLCVCGKILHLFHIRDRKYRFKINFYVFNKWLFAYCRPTYICLWTRSMRFHFTRIYKAENSYIK